MPWHRTVLERLAEALTFCVKAALLISAARVCVYSDVCHSQSLFLDRPVARQNMVFEALLNRNEDKHEHSFPGFFCG